jgi:hypothetical protein
LRPFASAIPRSRLHRATSCATQHALPVGVGAPGNFTELRRAVCYFFG